MRPNERQIINDSSKPQACLVIYDIQGGPNETIGRTYELGKSSHEAIIGNEIDVDVPVPGEEEFITRIRIYQDVISRQWHLENISLKHSFGNVLVNELKVRKKQLQDGDRIQVHSVTFRFLDGKGKESRYFQRLNDLIGTDIMTGLSNHRQLQEELLKSMAYCDRKEHPFCLLGLDFDDFSYINNTHGHPAGDAVLKEITTRIRKNIRTEDIFGREGGEEFLVGFPGLTLEVAFALIERVHREVTKEPVVFNDHKIQVTFSAGLAEWRPEPGSSERKKLTPELLKEELSLLKRRADDLMYEAKKQGKNRVVSN